MQRAHARNMRAITAIAVLVIGMLLTACGTGTTGTTSPPTVVPVTGSFGLATLISGPTETPAPRPTTFPTSTPIPRTGAPASGTLAAPTALASGTSTPRPAVTANALPIGAATSAPMNGMRDFTNPAAAYQVRYPEAWTVTASSESVTISPETGANRVVGFLVEPVRNSKLSAEDELRGLIMPSMGMLAYVPTGTVTPVMVGGEPGFRVDIRISVNAATPTTRGSATAPPLIYTGSLLTTTHKGVNYGVRVLARDNDKMTHDQAEAMLASLHFT